MKRLSSDGLKGKVHKHNYKYCSGRVPEYSRCEISSELSNPVGNLLNPIMASPPVWLITGSSAGIGTALTRYVLSKGHRVIATSRKPSKTPELVKEVESRGGHWLSLDVTSPTLEETIREAQSIHGHIDVLVNNAGYCVLGSVEQVPLENYREQMETNYYGPVRIMKAVLPSMRERRSGTIINISSAQGIVSAPGNGVYAASKFALEAISEALHKEAEPFGVKVALMELGAFKTTFGTGGDLVKPEGPYAEAGHPVGERLKWISKLGELAKGDPEKAAEVVWEVATGTEEVRDGENDGKPFLRFVLGEDCWKSTDGKIRSLRRTWDAQQEWCKRTTVSD